MRYAERLTTQTNALSLEHARIEPEQDSSSTLQVAGGNRSLKERPAWGPRLGILRWIAVAVWGAVILMLGTSYFSLARTAPIIDPVIRRFAPGASPETVYDWHVLVRWSAHFGEYAALYAALVIGPMRRRPLGALAMCIACASLDEGLQLLRPARSALICDVALDSSGAAAVMLLSLPRWISRLA